MRPFKAILFAVVFTGLYQSASAQLDKPAAEALIRRVIPAHSADFVVKEIPAENGKDVFEIQSRGGKIVLGGNKALSVASALDYYLKNYCHADFGWDGNQMKLPAKLPLVEETVHKATPYRYRYYLNYCTFNYSMSWWGWNRWQREIDWMALNGINMPLAITGEEAVWRRVYHQMGFTDKELASFFSGPAYFSWFWMGNLDGWDGPLPQHWFDTHEALQKQILARERALGMIPVLPAFSGHVPPSFRQKFPHAKLSKTNWGQGFNDVYILNADDPMFAEIGKKFIEEQTKMYGTSHYYSSDTFNENRPPSSDSTYLSGMSKKIYQSMAAADPKAVWVMQGWLFYNDSQFWKPAQIKALLDAVPNNRMIILDLYSDVSPEWTHTDSYYGKPWIWCMLQNFGGNNSLDGSINRIAADPNAALRQSPSMSGIGLTPEAIELNPVVYEMMMDNTWRDAPIDPLPWLYDYARRRYGKSLPDIDTAWSLLYQSVYNSKTRRSGVGSIIAGRPSPDMSNDWRVDTTSTYDPKLLGNAWKLFIQSAGQLKASDGFRYDLVDITRQVLADYANKLEPKAMAAYQAKDLTAFNRYSGQFLQLLDDMDKLLATRKEFLLGNWLASARSNGITPQEKNLYELNARDLVTLWGGRDSPLQEYSYRHWSGLVSGYYKPRWEMFFGRLRQSLAKKQPFDDKAYEKAVRDWEWAWVNKRGAYPDAVKGNSVDVAKQLYGKYHEKVTTAFE